MKTSEFAKAYDRPSPFVDVYSAYQPGVPLEKRMGDMLLWIMEHNDNSETDDFPEPQAAFNDRLYEEFMAHTEATPAARQLLRTPLEQILTPDAGDAELQRVHRMYSMLQYEAFTIGWQEMMFNTQSTDAERREGLRFGQLLLAVHSVRLSKIRSAMTGIEQGHQFFSDEMRDTRIAMNGILNELDTAIIGMGIAQGDGDLLIVNAPPRFESTNDASNVDFVAYHGDSDQVIGIQTKSGTDVEEAGIYDGERVMMIDGSLDFQGVIRTRTRRGSSRETEVIYPGLIAAETLASLKLHGGQTDIRERFNQTAALNNWLDANNALRLPNGSRGKINGTRQRAIRTVGTRLYDRLDAERPRREKETAGAKGRRTKAKAKRRR